MTSPPTTSIKYPKVKIWQDLDAFLELHEQLGGGTSPSLSPENPAAVPLDIAVKRRSKKVAFQSSMTQWRAEVRGAEGAFAGPAGLPDRLRALTDVSDVLLSNPERTEWSLYTLGMAMTGSSASAKSDAKRRGLLRRAAEALAPHKPCATGLCPDEAKLRGDSIYLLKYFGATEVAAFSLAEEEERREALVQADLSTFMALRSSKSEITTHARHHSRTAIGSLCYTGVTYPKVLAEKRETLESYPGLTIKSGLTRGGAPFACSRLQPFLQANMARLLDDRGLGVNISIANDAIVLKKLPPVVVVLVDGAAAVGEQLSDPDLVSRFSELPENVRSDIQSVTLLAGGLVKVRIKKAARTEERRAALAAAIEDYYHVDSVPYFNVKREGAGLDFAFKKGRILVKPVGGGALPAPSEIAGLLGWEAGADLCAGRGDTLAECSASHFIKTEPLPDGLVSVELKDSADMVRNQILTSSPQALPWRVATLWKNFDAFPAKRVTGRCPPTHTQIRTHAVRTSRIAQARLMPAPPRPASQQRPPPLETWKVRQHDLRRGRPLSLERDGVLDREHLGHGVLEGERWA